MEFFQHIQCFGIDENKLHQQLTISRLPVFCASIDTVITVSGDDGEIYCLWGQFTIQRLKIRAGVRFSLLNCPHALAWTVTTDESNGTLIVHCTTDKTQHDPDFTESIEVFVRDWAAGLRQLLTV
jgi:hypothetical protein